MEQIAFEVDSLAAETWKNISAEQRQIYAHKWADMLKETPEKEIEFTNEEVAIINEDAGGERYEWWNDEEMVAELEQIAADMESGKDKGFTIEESRAQLKLVLKKNG
jgi:hypothetical protein